MNIKNNPALQEKLAAEYVLGTLRGGARRRFETWLRQDAALLHVVREWQGNLMPMAEFSKAKQPASSVWMALEKRLNLGMNDRSAFWRKLFDDLSFWRGLGIVSTTAALVMVTVLLSKHVEQTLPVNNYVATLSDDKSQPIAVISSDIKHKQLIVRFVTAQAIASDKSLELWAISKAGTVKSLGLVASNLGTNTFTINMPENMTPENTPLLAVTLEPKGGSGNPEKPSGPIIFKGNWLQLS
ncbi:MAG: anti-sigma factor [Pseudomonadota bacterium]